MTTQDPLVQDLMNRMAARSEAGINKYKNTIDNAIEECLDQAVYLEKAKRELQEKWTLKH